ncbi:MAG: aspartate--tRNA ligase [Candidatus Altiarchaeota archaeon]|nr:aspartate--tRNA ligase [Candidatus Altiarchaeota archaeon]
MLRTHTCGELELKHKGKQVTLAGWVQSTRIMGKKAFVDLRDRYGITQVIMDEHLRNVSSKLTRESVLLVSGKVVKRQQANPKLATGDIEIVADTAIIISKADPLPFEIFKTDINTTEETRLKNRFLDMRRPDMQKTMEFRFHATQTIRNFCELKGFIEVETPYIGKPTPEGARDFIIPSRSFKGKYWALQQSPQIYKQLLMVAGFDKYFQMARCFRDEDLRADRQYEFTQVDIEMSFVEDGDVMKFSEGLIATLYAQLLGIKLKKPFSVIEWKAAIDQYGSDKPDRRFGMELMDMTDFMRKSGFKVFEAAAEKGEVVKGFLYPDRVGKKDLEKFNRLAKEQGFPGVAWVLIEDGELAGGISKHIMKAKPELIKLEEGTLFMLAGDWKKVSEALGAMRILGGDLQKLRKGLDVLWVVNFPLFEWGEELKGPQPAHHPFTAPKKGHEDKIHNWKKLTEKEMLDIPSRTYDLVINGVEIGGGSIRITDRELQHRAFEMLGISEKEAARKFGMLLDAFKYGVPPHGGIAFGLERLLQVMLGRDSVRDVMAFPKSKSGRALMEDAPNEADAEQLKELGI